MKVVVVGGTSGIGAAIARRLEVDCGVEAISSRTGFDVTEFAPVPNCDALVFCLRYRGHLVDRQFDVESLGPASLLYQLPRFCTSVVFISSVAARTVTMDQPWGYHASKAAVEQMVRYFAVHLGPVRVNAVAPGLVERDSEGKYDDFNNFLAPHLPLKRMVSETDVAEAVRFLIQPDCPLTGQTLTVDAGASLLNVESLLGRVHEVPSV